MENAKELEKKLERVLKISEKELEVEINDLEALVKKSESKVIKQLLAFHSHTKRMLLHNLQNYEDFKKVGGRKGKVLTDEMRYLPVNTMDPVLLVSGVIASKESNGPYRLTNVGRLIVNILVELSRLYDDGFTCDGLKSDNIFATQEGKVALRHVSYVKGTMGRYGVNVYKDMTDLLKIFEGMFRGMFPADLYSLFDYLKRKDWGWQPWLVKHPAFWYNERYISSFIFLKGLLPKKQFHDASLRSYVFPDPPFIVKAVDNAFDAVFNDVQWDLMVDSHNNELQQYFTRMRDADNDWEANERDYLTDKVKDPAAIEWILKKKRRNKRSHQVQGFLIYCRNALVHHKEDEKGYQPENTFEILYKFGKGILFARIVEELVEAEYTEFL